MVETLCFYVFKRFVVGVCVREREGYREVRICVYVYGVEGKVDGWMRIRRERCVVGCGMGISLLEATYLPTLQTLYVERDLMEVVLLVRSNDVCCYVGTVRE